MSSGQQRRKISEVCPFCGKTYKRLKSHLPHCKAAASSKTPTTGQHVTAGQTTASLSKTAAKRKKSTQTETATTSSPSPTKPKKQSLRALIEAAKMTSENLQSDSRPAAQTDSKSATDTHTKLTEETKRTKKSPQTVSRPHEGLRFWEDSDTTSKITLQDVRATLGRKTRSRPSILSQIEAAEVPPEKKSEQPALIPQREPASPPAAPLPPAVHSAPRAVSLKVTRPLHLPPTPHSEPGSKKQNTAVNPTEGALTHRSLGQVRLKELPDWLACKSPTHPKEVIEMVQRGWQWYYRKYIDVKKGGVAGVGMLLAGYCVLSYMWNFPHMKRDRWRKFH